MKMFVYSIYSMQNDIFMLPFYADNDRDACMFVYLSIKDGLFVDLENLEKYTLCRVASFDLLTAEFIREGDENAFPFAVPFNELKLSEQEQAVLNSVEELRNANG